MTKGSRNFLRARRLQYLGLLLLAGAHLSAWSKDCQEGTPTAEQCVAELKRLDQALARLHRLEQHRLAALFGPGSPEVEPGYAKEAITAFQAETAAWHRYRTIKCRSEALRSGMSIQYAGSVTLACEVSEARARVKALRHWLKP